MEQKKKVCLPSYERERKIFENEMMCKIKEYRSARTKWISSNMNQTIDKDELKELDKFSEQKGRIKEYYSSKFRPHFKTLRPLRYYVLKETVPPIIEPVPCEKPKADIIPNICKKNICTTVDAWSPEASDENLEMKPIKQPKRRQECTEIKKSGPCINALKRLKAAKAQQSMIESCRCDDGREVTVVIKGICLCDKTSLNNLKLGKVRDEYAKLLTPEVEHLPNVIQNQAAESHKMENVKPIEDSMQKEGANELRHKPEENPINRLHSIKPEEAPAFENKVRQPPPTKLTSIKEGTMTKKTPEKEVENVDDSITTLSHKSSLEVFKKLQIRKSSTVNRAPSTEFIVPEPAAQKVHFRTEDVERKLETKSKPKFQNESEVTIFKKLSEDNLSLRNSKPDPLAKGDKNTTERHYMTQTPPEKNETNEEDEEAPKLHRTEGVRRLQDSESHEKKHIESSPTKPDPSLGSLDNTNPSLITLLENKPKEASQMGLTKEQKEVLKKGNPQN